MDLLLLIERILLGQMKAQGQAQDPVPQFFFQVVLTIVRGYLAIGDHAAIS
jgi:hypothetical protein